MSDLQSFLDEALKKINIEDFKEIPISIDYDIEKEVRQLLLTTRENAGLTQKELSELTNISQSNISKFENGTHKPSIQMLKRLADAFGKRLIIKFEDKEEF